MSISILATVTCDSCGALLAGRPAHTVSMSVGACADALEAARRNGWVTLYRRGPAKHYCSPCADGQPLAPSPALGHRPKAIADRPWALGPRPSVISPNAARDPSLWPDRRATAEERAELAIIRAAIVSGNITPQAVALFNKYYPPRV